MRTTFESEFRRLRLLSARCNARIERTNLAIAHTQERVRASNASVERARTERFECSRIALRPSPAFPSLIDAEVFDDPESAAYLNEIAHSCSRCNSEGKALVALVRFASLDAELALCAECYCDLSDRSLGQVV